MIKPKTSLFFAAVCLFPLYHSCSILNKDEPIPAYLHIPGFELTTKADNTQGAADHDIKDAWVYIEGQLVGVFEIPVTIPILTEGKKEIVVFAGIKKNGSVGDRIIYPFYQGNTDTINFVSGHIDTILPKITYKAAAKFIWLEDFEDQSVSLEKFGTTPNIDTLFITGDPANVYKYNGTSSRFSGMVNFNNAPGSFFHANITALEVPRNENLFLEVSYRSDVAIQFGFLAVGSIIQQVPVLLTFQNTEWKKVYISLTEDLNIPQFSNSKIKIFVQASNVATSGDKRVYFDNFKLIHF